MVKARYFTDKNGKFIDGCLAVMFDSRGVSYFLRASDMALIHTHFWTLKSAEAVVASGQWIEVTEDEAYGRVTRDTPRTTGDIW